MKLPYQNIAIFDIETNGFLDKLDTMHSLVIATGDGKFFSCSDAAPKSMGYLPLAYGLDILEKADLIVGHNIHRFDVPALEKLYPFFKYKKAWDTLTMARLMFPDIGSHALATWGERLRVKKGDFGKQTDWQYWSQPMQNYCEQDVRVTTELWHHLLKQDYPIESIELEHEFADIMNWQMEMGIPFNEQAACKLAEELQATKADLEARLKETIPPHREIFMPKVNNSRYGYVKGQPVTKVTPFNFGSRTQVYKYLMKKHRWEPLEFTEKGSPKVSGDILRGLPYPETSILADYFDCKKLLGQLLEGDVAWLKGIKNGRIYGYINHNGAVTGRCTHSSPNLGQVPRVSSFKGRECRSLFTAEEGYQLVGCDASGLELRNLAHYMADYDGGAYASKILESDIHTENQKDAGLPNRDNAKTFIYALLYGSGDRNLGVITDPLELAEVQTIKGKQLRRNIMTNLPALKTLIENVKSTARGRGYLIGLDGRKLNVRSDHMALNTLLQAAGAVLMKKATVLQWQRWGRDRGYPVLHVHDETQNMIPEEYADEFARVSEQAIRDAGSYFNFRIPLDAEAKIGKTWAETH